MEGFLEKKPSFGFGWQQRYFRLWRKSLTYTKKRNDKNATELRIEDDKEIKVRDIVCTKVRIDKQDNRVFYVTIDKDMRLRAPNESMRNLWVDLLESFTQIPRRLPPALRLAAMGAISHLRLHALVVSELFVKKGDEDRVTKVKLALLNSAQNLESPVGSGKVLVPRGSNPYDVATALVSLLKVIPGGGILAPKKVRKAITKAKDKHSLRGALKELPEDNLLMVEALAKLFTELKNSPASSAAVSNLNHATAALAQVSESKRQNGSVDRLTGLLSTEADFLFSHRKGGAFGGKEELEHETEIHNPNKNEDSIDENLEGFDAEDTEDNYVKRKREERESRQLEDKKREMEKIRLREQKKMERRKLEEEEERRQLEREQEMEQQRQKKEEEEKRKEQQEEKSGNKYNPEPSEFGFSELDLSGDIDGDDLADMLMEDDEAPENKATKQKSITTPTSGRGFHFPSEGKGSKDSSVVTTSGTNKDDTKDKDEEEEKEENQQKEGGGGGEAKEEEEEKKEKGIKPDGLFERAKDSKLKIVPENEVDTENGKKEPVVSKKNDGEDDETGFMSLGKLKAKKKAGDNDDDDDFELSFGDSDLDLLTPDAASPNNNKKKMTWGNKEESKTKPVAAEKKNSNAKHANGNDDDDEDINGGTKGVGAGESEATQQQEEENEDDGKESRNEEEDATSLPKNGNDGKKKASVKSSQNFFLPEVVIHKEEKTKEEGQDADHSMMTPSSAQLGGEIVQEETPTTKAAGSAISRQQKGENDDNMQGGGLDAADKFDDDSSSSDEEDSGQKFDGEGDNGDGSVKGSLDLGGTAKRWRAEALAMEEEKGKILKELRRIRKEHKEEITQMQKRLEVEKARSADLIEKQVHIDKTAGDGEAIKKEEELLQARNRATEAESKLKAVRNEYAVKNAEVARLKAEIEICKSAADSSGVQVSSLEEQVQGYESKLAKANAIIGTAKAKEEELVNILQVSKSRNQELEANIDALKEVNESFKRATEEGQEKETMRLREQLKSASVKAAALTSRVDDLLTEKAALEKLTEEQKKEKEEIAQAKRDLEARVISIEKDKRRRADLLKSKIDTLEKECKSLMEFKDARERDAEKSKTVEARELEAMLSSEETKHKFDLESLREKLTTELENESKSCKETLRRKEDEIAKMKKQFAAKKEQLAFELESVKDNFQAELQALKDKSRMEREAADTKYKNTCTAHIEELKQLRNERNQQDKGWDANRASQAAQTIYTTAKYTEMQVLLDTARAERGNVQKTLDERNREVKTITQKLIEAEAEALRASESLKNEANRARSVEAVLDARVAEQRATIEDSLKKLQAVQAKYAALKSEHGDATQRLAQELRRAEKLSAELAARDEGHRDIITSAQREALRQSSEVEKLRLRLEVATRTIEELKLELRVNVRAGASLPSDNTYYQKKLDNNDEDDDEKRAGRDRKHLAIQNTSQIENSTSPDDGARARSLVAIQKTSHRRLNNEDGFGDMEMLASPFARMSTSTRRIKDISTKTYSVRQASSGQLRAAQERMRRLESSAKSGLQEARARLQVLRDRIDRMAQ
eukprot:jgi/Bigna1/66342/fgenesh1_pg.1_\